MLARKAFTEDSRNVSPRTNYLHWGLNQAQYKDVYSRTIEIPHGAYIFKAKVYNVHLE